MKKRMRVVLQEMKWFIELEADGKLWFRRTLSNVGAISDLADVFNDVQWIALQSAMKNVGEWVEVQ